MILGTFGDPEFTDNARNICRNKVPDFIWVQRCLPTAIRKISPEADGLF